MNDYCKDCLIKKNTSNYPQGCSKDIIREYERALYKIIDEIALNTSASSGPVVGAMISDLYKMSFGVSTNYSAIKSHYNSIMLHFCQKHSILIEQSKTPIKDALHYAIAGNMIDFSTLNVDEIDSFLNLNMIDNIQISQDALLSFYSDLNHAKTLVYLTDNCGELALDFLLMRELHKYYSDITINVIVRGSPTLNDATLEDAQQIGIDKMFNVIGNGTSIPGTSMDHISFESKKLILEADVIISKGQGNYETFSIFGKRAYYAFMCKCLLFQNKFNVKKNTGLFFLEENGVMLI